MPFPIQKINEITEVYVSDSQNRLTEIPFPLKGGLTLSEQEFLETEVKDKVDRKAYALMKTIAEKVAEITKQPPEEIAIPLVAYMRDGYAEMEKIEGVVALNDITEFHDFMDLLKKPTPQRRSKSDRARQCARVAIMMNRTKADKANGWDPRSWKSESALDPTEIPADLSTQISLLAQLEESGNAHLCTRTTLKSDGTAVNVFFYTDSLYEEAFEKLEKERSGAKEESPESESLEELAKK